MGLLDGKVAMVFGMANKNSIAWGIAQAFSAAGATVGMSYATEALERRVQPLAESIGCNFVEMCDVTNDEDLDAIFEKIAARFGKIDILVHSVAYATREDLGGRFVEISRDGFHLAMDISAYSLIALAKRAEPLMAEGGSIMCMTYYAAEKAVPGYNVMSIAKAALESITRYLAYDMGPNKIRVNAISAGPIKTLSAAGISGFRKLLKYAELVSPLRELVSQDDVGQLAVFLASDMSSMITGETIYIDAGYHVLGVTATDEMLDEV